MEKLYRAGMFVVKSNINLNLPLENNSAAVHNFNFGYRKGIRGLITERHVKKGNGIYTTKESVLIRHKNVGDIEVIDDGEIIFVKSPSFCGNDFDQIVSGPLITAMAVRSGVTVIHSSCISFEDKAILIVGPSGVGKSTLASYLAGEGWNLLSDDIVMLEVDNGKVFAWPTAPTSWLWKDSFEAIAKPGFVADTFKDNGKFAIPAQYYNRAQCVEVVAIIFPQFDDKNHKFSITDIDKNTKYNELSNQICGIAMMSYSNDIAHQKSIIDTILESCSSFRLIRPRNFKLLPKTHDALLKVIYTI